MVVSELLGNAVRHAAPLGSGDLLPCRFDAHTRHIHFGQQTLTFDLELGLSLDGLRTGACNA